MQLITIPEMQQVLEHVVVGQNEPAWFHGEAGCGKSEGIDGGCRKLDAQLIDFRLGQYQTVDFKGFPDIDRATNSTVWYMASTLPFVGNNRFDPNRKKVIFLDEADHGTDAVKGVAYQMLQERRVGEHVFQPNTFFAAAGNRPMDRGIGNKAPPPLNNRCTHYLVGPDAESWVQWAGTQPDIPPQLMAFLMFRKPLISNFDPKSTELAFATPRTWVKAGHYFLDSAMPERIKDASIAGAVGTAAHAEFTGFCNVIKSMPSIRDIENNPDHIPVPTETQVLWAVAVGIAGEMKPSNSGAFLRFLDRLESPEFSVLSWQLALKREEAAKKTDLLGTPEFLIMAKRHQDVFAQVLIGK